MTCFFFLDLEPLVPMLQTYMKKCQYWHNTLNKKKQTMIRIPLGIIIPRSYCEKKSVCVCVQAHRHVFFFLGLRTLILNATNIYEKMSMAYIR
jgi:hypothetical protein